MTAQEDVADYTLPRLTSEATLHRRPSGALVFAASTMRWSWGLDSARNDGNTGTSSRAIQQATINLLADMGVQPAFLRKDPTNVTDPELVRATASTDSTPPTSHSRSGSIPRPASSLEPRPTSAASSRASKSRSMRAPTWHGANLAESGTSTAWSYASVVPANVGGLVRAVDDSGNLEFGHASDSPIPPSSGQAVFSIAGNPAWQQTIVNDFAAAPGWTSVVPMTLNGDDRTDLVSYNAVTGQADYSLAVTAPSCPAGVSCGQQVASTVAASPGWTSVVPMDLNGDGLTDLLSYNAATGLSYYSVAVPGALCPGASSAISRVFRACVPTVPEDGRPRPGGVRGLDVDRADDTSMQMTGPTSSSTPRPRDSPSTRSPTRRAARAPACTAGRRSSRSPAPSSAGPPSCRSI